MKGYVIIYLLFMLFLFCNSFSEFFKVNEDKFISGLLCIKWIYIILMEGKDNFKFFVFWIYDNFDVVFKY